MNDQGPSIGSGVAPGSGAPTTSNPTLKCPPFDPDVLQRQMLVDAAVPWLAWIGFFFLLTANIWTADQSWANNAQTLLMVAVMALWFWAGTATARVAQSLAPITALISEDPAAAEAALAQALRRRPLQRGLRLLLYHRLMLLRHRQGRFPEAAAISQTLLTYRARVLRPMRANLLLILVESLVESGDLPGAWRGLAELHTLPLGLGELLQRMALQTRYEVAMSYDAAALADLPRKVQMAELLPAQSCGKLHDLWATAAERSGKSAAAAWLRRRAELLLAPAPMPPA